MKSKIYAIRILVLFFIVNLVLLSACKKEPVDDKDDDKDKNPNDTTQVEEYREVEFSILCYNVAGLPQGISSSDPEKYMTSISPLMNAYDVVHVQEDFNYHDSLLLYNSHPYKTPPSPPVPNGDGLNTFSNFPISNVERIPWTECTEADCLTPKGFYYSQIEIQGKTIDFYNLHCNAGGDEASITARRANIAQLTDYIAEHSEGKPVLLFGDFNCRYVRQGDSIRAVLDMGFKDAWIELIREGDIPALGSPRLDDCDPDRNSPDCEVVDKVFYRGNDEVEITALSFQTDDPAFYFEGDPNQELSDHWPLIAEFKLRFKVE
ncbi:MAG: endonuclease/exonuclease/phosphatase family protein [Chitinophagales bacterium]